MASRFGGSRYPELNGAKYGLALGCGVDGPAAPCSEKGLPGGVGNSVALEKGFAGAIDGNGAPMPPALGRASWIVPHSGQRAFFPATSSAIRNNF